MKCLKMLGLAAIAAGALMAFAGAGTASATELTCTNPPGTIVMCGIGTTIHAVAEGHVVLDHVIGRIECNSTIEGITSTTGGSGETVSGSLPVLTFTGCTNATVNVLRAGTLEIHGISGGHNGTLTSNGAEVTVEFSGFHCIFGTVNTHIGTITGSRVTGSMATLDIEATLVRTGGRSGVWCGSTARLTGSYQIESPTWFEVDP